MKPLSYLASKNLHTWAKGYARDVVRRRREPRFEGTRHLVFAFCDHWEPLWGSASREHGDRRVDWWAQGYPALVDDFRDADGKRPRHSFFFPGEQYHPEWLDTLGGLAKGGYGEVELHLHHDGDTEATLRDKLVQHTRELAQHGHLAREADGRLRWAFIHGNWALANGRRDGRRCGVDAELPLLFDTGCYADFTFPSAPDECQPNVVNQLYWPTGDLTKKRAYEQGERARVGASYDDRLLLVTGPLAYARKEGGRVPLRIESAEVTSHDPVTPARVRTWVSRNIHVEGRPEWVFVKVHTHGCPDREAKSLLGEDGRNLHRILTSEYNDGRAWALHYVTARELYNVAMAAMAGKSGNPGDYRDFVLGPPPVARA
jgi:hypothetical protein